MIVPGSIIEAATADAFAAFIDNKEFESISRFARRFPLAVHAHVLELRLLSDRRSADYQVCLKDDGRTLKSIRKYGDEAPSRLYTGTRGWRFLKAWAGPERSIRRHLPLLWLEYDRPKGIVSAAPGIFVAPEQVDGDPLDALNPALDILYSVEDAKLKRQDIAQVVSVLSNGARIRHLGSMPSRRANFMRLVIEGVDENLLPFLSALDWQGNRDFLADLLGRLHERAGMVPTLIDLDFHAGIVDNLGLEFFLVGDGVPEDKGKALLAFMQEESLCSIKKGETLERWLDWEIASTSDRNPMALWSKLYHIKFSIKHPRRDFPGRPHVECKAYWGAWGGPETRIIAELHAAIKRHLH